MWVPHVVASCSWSAIRRLAPALQTVTLQSAFPQPGGATIPGGSLTAPLVFVGHGTDADLAGRDVKGKIAVVHVRPGAVALRIGGAGRRGAGWWRKARSASINAIEGPGNAQYIDPRFACGKSAVLHGRRAGRLVPRSR